MRVLSRCEIDEISRLATTRGKVARGGSVDGELDDPILAASILLNDLTDAISYSKVADYNRMDGYGKLPHLVSGFYNHVVRTPRILPAFSIFTALLEYRVSGQFLDTMMNNSTKLTSSPNQTLLSLKRVTYLIKICSKAPNEVWLGDFQLQISNLTIHFTKHDWSPCSFADNEDATSSSMTS